jgi:hypothetical protein
LAGFSRTAGAAAGGVSPTPVSMVVDPTSRPARSATPGQSRPSRRWPPPSKENPRRVGRSSRLGDDEIHGDRIPSPPLFRRLGAGERGRREESYHEDGERHKNEDATAVHEVPLLSPASEGMDAPEGNDRVWSFGFIAEEERGSRRLPTSFPNPCRPRTRFEARRATKRIIRQMSGMMRLRFMRSL